MARAEPLCLVGCLCTHAVLSRGCAQATVNTCLDQRCVTRIGETMLNTCRHPQILFSDPQYQEFRTQLQSIVRVVLSDCCAQPWCTLGA